MYRSDFDRVKVGRKNMDPSDDLYNFTMDGKCFTFIYDIDDGSEIFDEDQNEIKALRELFPSEEEN